MIVLFIVLARNKLRIPSVVTMSKHAMQLPSPAPATAPAQAGSAAEPRARGPTCPVCDEPLRGAPALHCGKCACGPFHGACALPISGSQPRCPRCAQLVAARVAGTAAARVAGPRERVDLTGERGASGIRAGAADGGGGRRGGGARERCGHGKQRGKWREEQAVGVAALEQQAADGELVPG